MSFETFVAQLEKLRALSTTLLVANGGMMHALLADAAPSCGEWAVPDEDASPGMRT